MPDGFDSGNNKRKNKSFYWLADDIRGADDVIQCVGLTERDKRLIAGMAGYVNWPTRYIGEVTKAEVMQWYSQLLINILSNERCEPETPEETECNEFLPASPFITYQPNDPFRTPGMIPDGYSVSPWYADAPIPPVGVIPTDAMVSQLAFIPELPFDLLEVLETIATVGLPRARVHFTGEGHIEIETVKIPFGGVALMIVDDDPLQQRWVDLNATGLDLSTIGTILETLFGIIVAESLAQTDIQEFEITGTGSHHIDITFIPNIGTGGVGFGGGIRSVEICGEIIGDIEPECPECEDCEDMATIFRFTEECIMQQSTDDGETWVDVPGWGEWALACFQGEQGEQGEPGTNGTNGTDGEDGEDFIPVPFDLSGDAMGNQLLFDLITGLTGQSIVNDTGVILGEIPPPILPCELDACQLANVTIQWLANQIWTYAVRTAGEESGSIILDERVNTARYQIDVQINDMALFRDFIEDIWNVFYLELGSDDDDLNEFIINGQNYLINDVTPILACYFEECGYIKIEEFEDFLSVLPSVETYQQSANVLMEILGTLGFATISTFAKNSRLVESFMVECDDCDPPPFCAEYAFVNASSPFDEDWNAPSGFFGTYVSGNGWRSECVEIDEGEYSCQLDLRCNPSITSEWFDWHVNFVIDVESPGEVTVTVKSGLTTLESNNYSAGNYEMFGSYPSGGFFSVVAHSTDVAIPGTCTVEYVKFAGAGTNDFTGDNCL